MEHTLLYFAIFALISIANIASSCVISVYILISKTLTNTLKFWLIVIVGARTVSISAFVYQNVHLIMDRVLH